MTMLSPIPTIKVYLATLELHTDPPPRGRIKLILDTPRLLIEHPLLQYQELLHPLPLSRGESTLLSGALGGCVHGLPILIIHLETLLADINISWFATAGDGKGLTCSVSNRTRA